MADELKKTSEEKLRLLGERLREGAAKLRPVPKQVLDNALKPNQGLEQEETQKNSVTGRRRRRPSR